MCIRDSVRVVVHGIGVPLVGGEGEQLDLPPGPVRSQLDEGEALADRVVESALGGGGVRDEGVLR
eukprot:15343128-Alexandrium_andersonii.AAC.1